MKLASFTKHLPLGTLVAAILGGTLRAWLYTTGTDAAGLLVSSHPGHILILLLTALFAAFLLLGCLPLKQAARFGFNFPASPVSAAGCAIAAVGVFWDAIHRFNGGFLQILTGLLGLVSAGALLFIAFCRLKGRHPSVVFNSVVCLYLMMTLINLYQSWSATPQLQDYGFALLGCVFAMLACYHDASFAANCGNRLLHTFFHLMAVYLCVLALPHNDSLFFYLCLSVWMFTGKCNLTPMGPITTNATPEETAEEELPAAEEPVQPDSPAQALPLFAMEESFDALDITPVDLETVTLKLLSLDAELSENTPEE